MLKILAIVAFGAMPLLAQTKLGAASSPVTTLQGTVTDAVTNKPLAKAFVSATRTVLPPLRQTVRTAADGSFIIVGLPAASYTLCVQAATDGYLDACVWTPPGPTVTLTAGQSSAGHVLKMQPGSILKIHLDDPGQLLSKKTKTGYLPHLSLGVHTPQATLQIAHRAAATAIGADYQVTVPLDKRLVFAIQSFSLQLADANAAPLANSAAQQGFQHATGDANPVSFTYKITGLKP